MNLNYWLIPNNLEKFNAIKELKQNSVWWRNKLNNMKIGDIVYIYITKPIQKILIKTKIIDTDEINKKFCIELINFLDNNYFSFDNLLRNGLNGRIYSNMHINEKLLQYILKYDLSDDEINDKIDLTEGTKKEIIVNAYERNSMARKRCIAEYGYNCFICGFNFLEKYGEIGRDFIHVHHIKSLSEIKEKYIVDPINDLRPLCPNCHSMIHRKKPAYSIEELQQIIKWK